MGNTGHARHAHGWDRRSGGRCGAMETDLFTRLHRVLVPALMALVLAVMVPGARADDTSTRPVEIPASAVAAVSAGGAAAPVAAAANINVTIVVNSPGA